MLVSTGTSYAQITGVCDEPVREFSGGHGRRPGPTIVKIEMRQNVRDSLGKIVSANSDQEIALIEGDEVTVLVDVNNSSIYDVANVIISHTYKVASFGPEMESIVSVMGGTYDPSAKTFRIELIPGGATVQLSFRIFLHGDLREGISQTKLKMEDFVVLESDRRFLQRTPESGTKTRQNIERVGIGGVEVSCFTGSPSDVLQFMPMGSALIASSNPPMEYEAYTAPEPSVDIPLITANVAMGYRYEEEPADVQVVRSDVMFPVVAPSVVVPQTGIELGDLLLNVMMVLLGVVIGFLVYGITLRWIWIRV